MNMFYHSVRLDALKCNGCTNCIKRCPTEAIRVRNGKARIVSERCIDCGECIRICPYRAKKAQSDPLGNIWNYKYKIALPSPALCGQFNNLDDIDYILTALKMLGFDSVFEVARAAELVSAAIRMEIDSDKYKKPVISSACPAISRLIRVRFPELCQNVLTLNSPMQEAGRLARLEAMAQTDYSDDEIGVFMLSPCPAKVTDTKAPLGARKSYIDGAISISEIYPRLLRNMEKIREPEQLTKTGIIGVSWAGIGGESASLLRERYLAADGIENVIKVLEELEDDKLRDLDYVELNACSGGCVGGALTVENPYVAKARIQRLRKYLPVSRNHLTNDEIPDEMRWDKPLEAIQIMKLADNIKDAMTMMQKIEEIYEFLPGLDCGTCGAPSCKALAEDVVRGAAHESDCTFLMMSELESDYRKYSKTVPARFRKTEDEYDGME